MLIITLRSILCKSELAVLSSLTKVVYILGFRRWEVPIEGVILDGQRLPASAQSGSGLVVSALVDTVITFLRVF